MLRARDSLSKEIRTSMSEMIQARVLNMQEFTNAKIIGAYHPIGSEVSTQKILSSALEVGKRLALPRVEGEDRMVFAEVKDLGNDLRAGPYNIMEPKKSCQQVKDLGMLLLPGVAWDIEGYRLGYGKGYYDRYLSGIRTDVKKVGLAYDLQVLEMIPHNAKDLRVDAIVTEKRVIMQRK